VTFKSSRRTFSFQAFYARQIRLENIVFVAVRPGSGGIGGAEEGEHGFIHGGGNVNRAAVIADNKFAPADCFNQFADAGFSGSGIMAASRLAVDDLVRRLAVGF
jgi:hypothetical protein